MRGVGWGSHVLIDRLNSTDYLSVVHDSADVTRHSKTARVAQSETGLRYLRVCYSSQRSTTAEPARSAAGPSWTWTWSVSPTAERIFAESVPIPEVLAEFEIPTPGALNFAQQTVRVARSLGRDDVVLALKRAIHRYEAEQVTKHALRLQYTLRRHPEFLEAFTPRQRKAKKPKPRRALPPPPPPPPPTLRAVLAHRLPESVAAPLRRVVRRTRAGSRRHAWAELGPTTATENRGAGRPERRIRSAGPSRPRQPLPSATHRESTSCPTSTSSWSTPPRGRTGR